MAFTDMEKAFDTCTEWERKYLQETSGRLDLREKEKEAVQKTLRANTSKEFCRKSVKHEEAKAFTNDKKK